MQRSRRSSLNHTVRMSVSLSLMSGLSRQVCSNGREKEEAEEYLSDPLPLFSLFTFIG